LVQQTPPVTVARQVVTALRPVPLSPNQLLTIPEAARYLNVPVRWVQDAVAQRRVRCTRIGKHVRFTADHLRELVEAGEQPVTTPAAKTETRPGGRRARL
jgi:excisionase family DNA binding protein